MTNDQMREVLKTLNTSPKWLRKIINLTPREVSEYYRRLKKQNQF